MTASLIRTHVQHTALIFAMEIYQRFHLDDLCDDMANEFTLYGSLLSLGALCPTPDGLLIREAYHELETKFVEGYMGPEPELTSEEAPQGTEYDALAYHQEQRAALEAVINNLDGTGGWV